MALPKCSARVLTAGGARSAASGRSLAAASCQIIRRIACGQLRSHGQQVFVAHFHFRFDNGLDFAQAGLAIALRLPVSKCERTAR